MQAERSGLGPAVLGGIIGAAVGVGLQTVLETGLLGRRIEASWFAIVIGILTGLGVRMMNRHHMGRSYARGAISGLIALAAIVASSFAVQEVMKRREGQAKTGPIAVAKADANADDAAAPDDEADAEATEQPAEEPERVAASADRPAGMGGAPKGGPSDINPWQFVFMALGGLVAYELGRGVDHAKRGEVIEGEPREPLVGGTDPSN